MRSITFVDEELIEKIDELVKDDTSESDYPEYEFVASCLKIGLTINNLKELNYIEVMKILYSFIENKKVNNNERNATQADIDRFLG